MASAQALRVLFLHGFTQNGTLFSAKTAALRKALSKAFPPPRGQETHFSYPTGPFRIALADIPGFATPDADDGVEDAEPDTWGWWVMKGGAGGVGKESKGEIIYEGLEKSLDLIAAVIREEGPFDGVIGFSQGAAAAVMVASLLEGTERFQAFQRQSLSADLGGMEYPQSFLVPKPGDDGSEDPEFIQPPLKFAVCYCGFRAPNKRRYPAFYEPKIKTSVLHVLGQVDVVVEETRGRALIDACADSVDRIVVHPGGHFVPSQKPWLDAVVRFIKACLDQDHSRSENEKRQEGRVEDMDVPF